MAGWVFLFSFYFTSLPRNARGLTPSSKDRAKRSRVSINILTALVQHFDSD